MKYKYRQKKNLRKIKTVENAPVAKINAQIRYLKEMINNKKMLIIDGMYLPDKMRSIMQDIKTVNFRLSEY